jgi:ABC-type nitrate/sulfonate/bicarbonate transport system substrate-binding protein
LRALAEGTQWFLSNVEESAEIAADETSMEERHALRACRALEGNGVLTTDLKFGPAALDAAIRSLRASGGLPEGAEKPLAALDYSYLEGA